MTTATPKMTLCLLAILAAMADLGNPAALWTMLTLTFSLGLSDDGDYKGSTLVLDGRVDFGGGGAAERAVVGGTGRFRRARGYSLTTKFGNPTPSTGFPLLLLEYDPISSGCK
uniref:Dirigent protein n=1 Tax=Oryza rufipogon TaxID=4529 RepID=A0A0E0NW76_ORYRU